MQKIKKSTEKTMKIYQSQLQYLKFMSTICEMKLKSSICLS